MNGKKVKMLLIEQEISQKLMAEKVGVSETFLSQIIMGYKAPSVALLKRIADFLCVKVDDIIA